MPSGFCRFLLPTLIDSTGKEISWRYRISFDNSLENIELQSQDTYKMSLGYTIEDLFDIPNEGTYRLWFNLSGEVFDNNGNEFRGLELESNIIEFTTKPLKDS